MLSKLIYSISLLLCLLPMSNAKEAELNFQINEDMDVVNFIAQAYTPTFDCPSASLNDSVNKVLSLSSLSPQQTLQLTSMKTHGLICAGNDSDAEVLLQRLLASENADRSARYYLSAIFQYGFVYDLKENPERCDYYMLARDSAKDKFADVYLSASLGFITECVKDDVNSQVFSLSQLLETTAESNDPAALAHVYNRVGLFYANRNQTRLAASQYLKAYETGKDIYTQDNLLSILGGAMTAYTSSGDMNQVKEVLDKFVAINATVNTPRTRFLQYYYQARYYSIIKDYENLASSLRDWETIAGDDENPIHQGLHRRYQAVLCYQQQDVECLKNFLESERNAPVGYLNYIQGTKHYLQFIVEANLFLGNKEASENAFAAYVEKMQESRKKLESHNDTFDVITLHNKILNLETSLTNQEEKRNLLAWLFVSVLFIILLFILWCVRRKYLENRSYDSVTGLLNNHAIIKKLTHLAKPSPKCTNALAIFDIANFLEMNSILASTQSDFVLQQIANTLRKITRSSDLLGRYGPEQFILCLVNIEEDAAQAFFERVKEALANTFPDHNRQHAISVDSSMSILYSSETFSDIDEILKNMLLSLSMKAGHA